MDSNLLEKHLNDLIIYINEIYRRFNYWKFLHQKEKGHIKWNKVCENEVALILDEILLKDIILSVARLLDPAKSCGRENLSLEYIFTFLIKDPHFDQIFQNFLEKHDSFIKSVLNVRNRLLSHNDLKKEYSKSIKPDIESFFEDLEKIIMDIKNHNKLDISNFNCRVLGEKAIQHADSFLCLFK